MDEGQNMMMAHHDGVDGTEERKHSSCLQQVLVLVVHDILVVAISLTRRRSSFCMKEHD